MDSFSGLTASISANGWFFGVVGGANATLTGAGGLFANSDTDSIGIQLYGGSNGDMILIENAGGTETETALTSPTGSGAPDIASLQDGFAISLTVNSNNTWSAFSTGLSTDFNTNGILTKVLYADVADALVASTTIQGSNPLTNTIGEVSLTAHEPSVLVQYDITGMGDITPDIAHSDLTAANLRKEIGVTGGNGNPGWLFNGLNFDADGIDGGDNAAADTDDQFFTFSLTADAGKLLDVDSINWTVGVKVAGTRDAFHYSLVYVSEQSDFSNILAQSGDIGQDASTAPGGLSVVGYHEESFTFEDPNITGYETLYFAVESSANVTHGNVDPVYRLFEVEGAVYRPPQGMVTVIQ